MQHAEGFEAYLNKLENTAKELFLHSFLYCIISCLVFILIIGYWLAPKGTHNYLCFAFFIGCVITFLNCLFNIKISTIANFRLLVEACKKDKKNSLLFGYNSATFIACFVVSNVLLGYVLLYALFKY
jgi:Na+/H+-translocating membrane pyrophosphatase